MTNTDTPARAGTASAPQRRSAARRRLRRAIGTAFARGAAHAAGTGVVGLLFWWFTHR
ncbi:hypothetical protein MF672_033640 [Actinomadura sp. ATCC 31491]|uniref:Uncharacterized protein n=1 Tax=Actinomadura luzonensis TaxID=2805427 RepID=A0ABT0G2S0_9ACTN|nr:hypothetical protein [Actinomadura luzonensis]MCK2218703.1 hypothetical protein [Actinomadura luzonensis]